MVRKRVIEPGYMTTLFAIADSCTCDAREKLNEFEKFLSDNKFERGNHVNRPLFQEAHKAYRTILSAEEQIKTAEKIGDLIDTYSNQLSISSSNTNQEFERRFSTQREFLRQLRNNAVQLRHDFDDKYKRKFGFVPP